jgi:1-aminocyclopropane-1-carboxylate deaminase
MTDLLNNPEHEVQDWKSPGFKRAGIEVQVLRGDLFHPWIQGNKWYKLRHFASLAEKENSRGFISVGGPWSNHLQAIGAFAAEKNLKTVFVIRGEESEWKDYPSVLQLRKTGARLFGISRSHFRMITSGKATIRDFLPDKESFKNYTEVPLGASCPETVEHTAKWAEHLIRHFDFTDLILPVASGGTLAGMLAGLPEQISVHGIDVLSSKGGLVKTTEELLRKAGMRARATLHWHDRYHFGSYAQNSPELISFMKELHKDYNIPSEHVYSGKAFFAVSDLADKGQFLKSKKLLVLHTGGLFQWQ